MFAEFLDRQPMETLLAKELTGIFPTVQDRAEWAEVSRQYGAELEQVCAPYRSGTPLLLLLQQLFHIIHGAAPYPL